VIMQKTSGLKKYIYINAYSKVRSWTST
jgi:hypothetical protein